MKTKLLLFICGIFGLGLIIYASLNSSKHTSYLDIQIIDNNLGAQIWLVEDHSLPIISINFAFPTGSAYDPVDRQGLARATAQMLNQGAGDYDNKAFKELLNNQNISLSFNSGRDSLLGSLKTLTKYKDNAQEYLKLALTQPRFEQEELDRFIEQEKTRIRSNLSDPGWVSARIVNDKVFEGHPYAQNSGGTLQTLGNITVRDLQAFSQKALSRKNLVISVVGDITPRDLKTYLEDIFADLPESNDLNETPDLERQNTGENYLYQMNVPQTFINVIWDGIPRKDPDYYTFQVMNYIFGGGGFGSRLMDTIREDKGLTYGVYSSLVRLDHARYYTASLSTQNSTAQQALDLILQEAEKLVAQGVSEDELDAAKDYLIGSLPLKFTSSDQIASVMLGLQLDKLPADILDTRNQHLQSVTREDVQRVAKRLLTSAPLVIAVGTPQDIDQTNWTEVKEIPNAQ